MENLFDDPAAKEIQKGFLANTASRVQEMIDHIGATPDDMEPIQGFGHQMKGSGQAMGFPARMFTVMFALGRLPGWIAQWREMITDPQTRIGRPRQVYVGEVERNYLPIGDR